MGFWFFVLEETRNGKERMGRIFKIDKFYLNGKVQRYIPAWWQIGFPHSPFPVFMRTSFMRTSSVRTRPL
ncbi:MAG: hypothetical protein B6D34_03815 [Candidatus Brocadia sp. UTAMX1]|jgi:hypothetical protein|nr:MAG: hypothetical protein B6D34_03815 [Candidatus Brocadia sp. UTAMX1]